MMEPYRHQTSVRTSSICSSSSPCQPSQWKPAVQVPVVQVPNIVCGSTAFVVPPPSALKSRNLPDYSAWRRLHVSKAKLTGVGEIATFLAGFAVVATVELQINNDANPVLLIAFTITTGLLVCTTMMSIMISTCLLPHITVVSKVGHPDAHPRESPHERLQFFVDLSWVLANTISIFLFTMDVILLCWIKYAYFSRTASLCATAIMIPVLLVIVTFGVVFYRNMLEHQGSILSRRCEELEELKRQLDLVPKSYFGLDTRNTTHHV